MGIESQMEPEAKSYRTLQAVVRAPLGGFHQRSDRVSYVFLKDQFP